MDGYKIDSLYVLMIPISCLMMLMLAMGTYNIVEGIRYEDHRPFNTHNAVA